MKILVTGAAGFIGTHLCNELRVNDHEVVDTDHQEGDLRDPYTISNLLDLHHPEVVVHLAAKVGRLFGEDNLTDTIVDNAAMTAIVSKACGDRGVRLVYASTSEIYGDFGLDIAYEDVEWKLPHNLYGLSKRWGEEVAQLYSPEGLVCLRLSMPYGPGLPAGRGRAAMINFLYNALMRKKITVHRDSERSWCWIGDTVKGIRTIIESGESGAWNVGRDDIAVPMVDVALKACHMTDAPLDIIEMVDAPGRQTVVKRLSTDKLRSLGWEPEVELDEGMERTLDWIKDGFQPISNKEAVSGNV